MIHFRRFSKRFGPHTAVADLSLDVAPGEVVALLGPNGSGKTTTLKAAAGLIGPSGGDVLIGNPARPASAAAARKVCSFLPQKVAFPDQLTGHEVVEFYRRLRGASPERGRDVLRAAALNGSGARYVGSYSGGMMQRLGLAVAMLPDAPVLLLDEPTAALDPDGLCTFYGLVERRRDEGRTVLFTSHQLGDVERLADRLAVLVSGRLVATFTEQELADRLADRGVMRLRVSTPSDAVLFAAQALVAKATWAGHDLLVPGATGSRGAVVAAVQQAGGEIVAITAEEGRLDMLYRELVGGEHA